MYVYVKLTLVPVIGYWINMYTKNWATLLCTHSEKKICNDCWNTRCLFCFQVWGMLGLHLRVKITGLMSRAHIVQLNRPTVVHRLQKDPVFESAKMCVLFFRNYASSLLWKFKSSLFLFLKQLLFSNQVSVRNKNLK